MLFFEKRALPPYTPGKGLALCKPPIFTPKQDLPHSFSIDDSVGPNDTRLINCPLFGASSAVPKTFSYQKKISVQLSFGTGIYQFQLKLGVFCRMKVSAVGPSKITP